MTLRTLTGSLITYFSINKYVVINFILPEQQIENGQNRTNADGTNVENRPRSE